jgi:hypothetical protein
MQTHAKLTTLFYRYAIPYNQRPTTSVAARRYQLRYAGGGVCGECQ